jgi:hypothetical protein
MRDGIGETAMARSMIAREKTLERQFDKADKADKDAKKAAQRITIALDALVRKLGCGVAPQTAFATVIREQTIKDPNTVELFERAWEGLTEWRRDRAAREWRETNPNLH